VLYLLDANVLITANSAYYPIDQVPEFWGWMHHQASSDQIKIPREILEEIRAGRKDDDQLLDWISSPEIETALFLIAYALAQPTDRTIVTTEVSRPSALRANRKVPDVCQVLGVPSCGPFSLNKVLGFRTGWQTSN